MSKGLQIAIAALTVCAGGGWLIAAGSAGEDTFQYYANVGAYLHSVEEESRAGDTRVHGFVVAGSIRKDLPAGHVDFRLADPEDPSALVVRYLGIDVPDLFADGAEVVVEGDLVAGVFVAQRVMAKCPSKYEARIEA